MSDLGHGPAPIRARPPAGALSGDRYGIEKAGLGVLTIDPVRLFGTTGFNLADFRVSVALTPSQPAISEVLYKIVDVVIGLRVPVEAEREGLDLASHGEAAYHN